MRLEHNHAQARPLLCHCRQQVWIFAESEKKLCAMTPLFPNSAGCLLCGVHHAPKIHAERSLIGLCEPASDQKSAKEKEKEKKKEKESRRAREQERRINCGCPTAQDPNHNTKGRKEERKKGRKGRKGKEGKKRIERTERIERIEKGRKGKKKEEKGRKG